MHSFQYDLKLSYYQEGHYTYQLREIFLDSVIIVVTNLITWYNMMVCWPNRLLKTISIFLCNPDTICEDRHTSALIINKKCLNPYSVISGWEVFSFLTFSYYFISG